MCYYLNKCVDSAKCMLVNCNKCCSKHIVIAYEHAFWFEIAGRRHRTCPVACERMHNIYYIVHNFFFFGKSILSPVISYL